MPSSISLGFGWHSLAEGVRGLVGLVRGLNIFCGWFWSSWEQFWDNNGPNYWCCDQNLLKAGLGVRGVAGVPVRKSEIGKFNPDCRSNIKVRQKLGK